MNHLRLIVFALASQSLSKDPSTKVGAIAFDDDCNVLSTGFNGFPRGVKDTEERYNDRTQKYPRTAHAEFNACLQASRNGIRLMGSNLLVTELHPCNICTQAILQAGIKKVYAPKDNSNSRWNEQSLLAAEMLAEAGVPVEYYDITDSTIQEAVSRLMRILAPILGKEVPVAQIKVGGQSKLESLVESLLNIAIGYGVAIASQIVIFPLFDIHVPISTNLWIGAWFTAISLARSYVIRRWFNARLHKAAIALAHVGEKHGNG